MNDSDFKYSIVRLLIGKENPEWSKDKSHKGVDEQYTYFHGYTGQEEDCWKRVRNFLPGNYVIHVTIDWF